ncbi:hypothetical protein F9U64_00120 [Gracilibacillus oryzae]|uniref:Uncharacterized protein n=1 Tax=Gracilibacillus oryzae TaxID=1672701 RepID=A0A7C8GVU9_9BACI|nr:hypothetical protein [Gracilibacillus oryzae]KAB8139475.1 hypothetical protein F9U64_00120 [Gracilibacillus oryzae]
MNNNEKKLLEERMQQIDKEMNLLTLIEQNLRLMKELAIQAEDHKLPAYKRSMINQTFQQLQEEVNHLSGQLHRTETLH